MSPLVPRLTYSKGPAISSLSLLTHVVQADGDVIVSTACGDAHSALLAASGAVYTAGCNKQGQCAQGMMLQMVRPNSHNRDCPLY